MPGEDCTLVFTLDGFEHFTADEHAVRLRDVLGKRLDAHDDERGIFLQLPPPSWITKKPKKRR